MKKWKVMKRIYLFILTVVCTILSRGQTNIVALSLENIATTDIRQNMSIQCDTTIGLNYSSAITGLSVSGTIILHHASNSLVRITLQDDYNTEYLVYELYPLLADSTTATFENVAFETSVLDNVTAERLNIKIVNATLQLDEINTSTHMISNYATRQTSTLNAHRAYTINKLNENLEKNNMTWRAGETSISQLTYEEKKAMFGGEVPNLGGLEYYVGGVFVMPNYDYNAVGNSVSTLSATSSSTSYVSEWDWRNRHGKNWMTPVKNQGLQCGSCWSFAAIGAIESYTNLYYNKLLNIDLSEQEIVSCYGVDGCRGGNPQSALQRSKNYGIIDEESFPYVGINGNCDSKSDDPKELIKIENHQLFVHSFYPENGLKEILHKAPIVVDIPSWRHFLTLVGYYTVQVGDEIVLDEFTENKTIIEEGSPLIGATAWILKNSWGESFGEDGYIYLVTDWENFGDANYIVGEITSLQYNEDSIAIEDADNDGYYFWGIGEKPEDVPSWAQEKADGDDSNPLYGALDAYGNLENISLSPYPDITINTEVVWNEDDYIYNNVRIVNGGKLTVSANIKKYFASTITVENGGELIINGGSIVRGSIVVKNSGTMSITNGGEIQLSESNNLKIEQGGILNQSLGKVKIID